MSYYCDVDFAYSLAHTGTFYGSVQCGSLVWAEELLKGGWAK